MSEDSTSRERSRFREGTTYNEIGKEREEFNQRQVKGKVVIWPDEREWEISKQNKAKYYMVPNVFHDTCNPYWRIFIQEIPPGHVSGKHTHQGGLVIFVLDGYGRTSMDDEICNWEEGDLVVLPIKRDGVAHQHFNDDPKNAAHWIALSNPYMKLHVGDFRIQNEVSQLWRETHGDE